MWTRAQWEHVECDVWCCLNVAELERCSFVLIPLPVGAVLWECFSKQRWGQRERTLYCILLKMFLGTITNVGRLEDAASFYIGTTLCDNVLDYLVGFLVVNMFPSAFFNLTVGSLKPTLQRGGSTEAEGYWLLPQKSLSGFVHCWLSCDVLIRE